MWTIETFTMFYPKTFAQRNVIPTLGLVPLLLSISTFVYDYTSDINLTLEYYWSSSLALDPVPQNRGLCLSSPSTDAVDEVNLSCNNATAAFSKEQGFYLER